MIEREVAKMLLESARPPDCRCDSPICLSQTKKQFLAVLGQKTRSGLQQASLATPFGFHCDCRSNCVAIAGLAAEAKSDCWPQFRHYIFQNSQLGAVTVLQNHFDPAILVNIAECEGSAVFDEVQPNGCRYVGECAVAIIQVKNISLESTPGAIGAYELVDGIPALLVIMFRLRVCRRIGDHLAPKETVQVFASGSRNHAVGNVKVRESIMIKIPGVARPRPAPHRGPSARPVILEATRSAIMKQRVAHSVLTVKSANFFARIFLEDLLP